MLDALKDLYDKFPGIMIESLGASPERLDPTLLRQLREHRDMQLELLGGAQVFRIESEATEMLFGLIRELGAEAAEDVFNKVRFPFPILLLECITEGGSRRSALVVQEKDQISSQTFAMSEEGCLPSLLVATLFNDGQFATDRTPVLDLIEQVRRTQSHGLDEEISMNQWFIRLAVSFATLIQHKGMLEVEDRGAYSRAERRRAERSGRPLPDTRISVIRLGEAGRGQRAAMLGGAGDDGAARAPVRAHWVRGHFMRNPSGGLSWRMPHIRGAGPLIGQARRVMP